MKPKHVKAVFFSPTKNTARIVKEVASAAAREFELETAEFYDMTCPKKRSEDLVFSAEDLMIIGTPTYAGRVPNKIMPFIRDRISGKGACCAMIVTYGNRSFDDALIELKLLMEDNGFIVLGGGAFVCQHVFAPLLAAGRPDQADLADARTLGTDLGKKLLAGRLETPDFPGNRPPGPYYIPKRTDGKPAVFLKAKPVTDQSRCIRCGACASVCPMGSIEEGDYQVTGICIKCQACISGCPVKAKSMIDSDFLSHKEMLESHFAEKQRENLILL